MLYSRFKGSEATRYGSLEEACHQYVHCQQHGYNSLKTMKTGSVISLDNPLLAASPNDKVHDPTAIPPHGPIEYKNPHSKQLIIPEACQQLKKISLEKTENNTYQLNQSTISTIKFNASSTAQIQCGVDIMADNLSAALQGSTISASEGQSLMDDYECFGIRGVFRIFFGKKISNAGRNFL